MKNNQKLIQNYFIAYLSVFTTHVFKVIYLYYFNIERDLPYIDTLIIFSLFSLLEALLVILFYYIFFNFIYKIKLKNMTIYFLTLFISFIFSIVWEISYTGILGHNSFTSFYFNNDYWISFLLYIVGIGSYGYYLKNIKK